MFAHVSSHSNRFLTEMFKWHTSFSSLLHSVRHHDVSAHSAMSTLSSQSCAHLVKLARDKITIGCVFSGHRPSSLNSMGIGCFFKSLVPPR